VSAPYLTASRSLPTSSSIRRGDGGVPEVRVDLDAGDPADGHGLELAGEVVYVRRYYQAAAGYLGSYQLGVEGFALGDELHGGGDLAIAREAHWVRAVRGVDIDIFDSLRRCEPDQVLRDSLSLAAELGRGTPVMERI